MQFDSTLKPRLIYVMRINDDAHKGCLKIGEATIPDGTDVFDLKPNSKILIDAAKKRIDQYTKTAGIKYEILHTEIGFYVKDKTIKAFNDKEVHDVLKRSKVLQIKDKGWGTEWFKTDLETVKKAIQAKKEGKNSLLAKDVTEDNSPIVFRPEQREAIDKTKKQFEKGNRMLWNAKMRFGKTLSTLQLVKEMNFKRSIILTHRPVVDEGWFVDFKKVFYDRADFLYGSKKQGEKHSDLEKKAKSKKEGCHYVYFASMQDLRGSDKVGGKFDKNNEVFATKWDFLIIDEAHEGTKTELGESVVKELTKSKTKVLSLSGTPFNIMSDFTEDEVFTWDYVMEQKAKAEWDEKNFGDHNPYSILPKMNIFTYNLGKLVQKKEDESMAFNFHEFFRVNEHNEETFVHEEDVVAMLDLMCTSDIVSAYPFSNDIFRNLFRHTLWMVPGVKPALALQRLLERHTVFQHFSIVNVAGEGDPTEEENKKDLELLNSKITDKPEETLTITLSCGRLTTGVSVPAWTAVFMLSGSVNTAAATYMQTIFRVQTPANINGRIKDQCYVFDFAPDRTLKVLADTVKISAKAGKTKDADRKRLGEFLNFCPVIGMEGSKMVEYGVNTLLESLKKIYIERVVNSGFDDTYLYNDKLLDLSDDAIKELDDLKGLIGTTPAMPKTGNINVNNQDLTGEEHDGDDTDGTNGKKKRDKKEFTPEERKRQEEINKKKQQRAAAISILRGISIRMPLMIYGTDIKSENDEITIDNFTEYIDAKSWEEFMPRGVSKNKFNAVKKYYDPEIFAASARRIRRLVRAADNMEIAERIKTIADIFLKFRNPDKETVLTPWRVVNMHLSDTLGGYSFFDEEFKNPTDTPVFIQRGKITDEVFCPETKILEINSKTGLYPLYVAYSVFRSCLNLIRAEAHTVEEEWSIWKEVLKNNIFIVCRTPMARNITIRTLAGFREISVNAAVMEDITEQIKTNPDKLIKKIHQGKSYSTNNNSFIMKFNAVVGNPPYQEMDGGNGTSAGAVYNLFVEIAKKIDSDYISMIMPARWYAGGKGLDDFRNKMLNDKKIKEIVDFPNCNDLFPTVDIAGGLCYFLRADKEYEKCVVKSIINGKSFISERVLNEYDIFVRDNRAVEIINKVNCLYESTLDNIVSSRKPFGLPTNYEPKKSGVPCYFIQKIGRKCAYKKDIVDSSNLLDKWKLIAPKSPIAGQTDFTKPVGFYYDGNTNIAKPGECCTESFIVLGGFDTEEEVLNFKSYIMTKTVRFLLLQAVVSQDVTKKCFCFVPDLGTYKEQYTDQILCERWNITEEEWNYIDSRICNIKGQK